MYCLAMACASFRLPSPVPPRRGPSGGGGSVGLSRQGKPLSTPAGRLQERACSRQSRRTGARPVQVSHSRRTELPGGYAGQGRRPERGPRSRSAFAPARCRLWRQAFGARQFALAPVPPGVLARFTARDRQAGWRGRKCGGGICFPDMQNVKKRFAKACLFRRSAKKESPRDMTRGARHVRGLVTSSAGGAGCRCQTVIGGLSGVYQRSIKSIRR